MDSTSDFELREVAESKAYTFRRFGDWIIRAGYRGQGLVREQVKWIDV